MTMAVTVHAATGHDGGWSDALLLQKFPQAFSR